MSGRVLNRKVTQRPFCYQYPRPALTVDIAVLRPASRRRAAVRKRRYEVLLIRRRSEPFKGSWALPGGFVNENEPLEAAACRELAEETAVRDVPIQQLATFGDPGRDPRGWTVSVAYYTKVRRDAVRPKADDDATEVGWFPLSRLPDLAFDHKKILTQVREALGVRH